MILVVPVSLDNILRNLAENGVTRTAQRNGEISIPRYVDTSKVCKEMNRHQIGKAKVDSLRRG